MYRVERLEEKILIPSTSKRKAQKISKNGQTIYIENIYGKSSVVIARKSVPLEETKTVERARETESLKKRAVVAGNG